MAQRVVGLDLGGSHHLRRIDHRGNTHAAEWRAKRERSIIMKRIPSSVEKGHDKNEGFS